MTKKESWLRRNYGWLIFLVVVGLLMSQVPRFSEWEAKYGQTPIFDLLNGKVNQKVQINSQPVQSWSCTKWDNKTIVHIVQKCDNVTLIDWQKDVINCKESTSSNISVQEFCRYIIEQIGRQTNDIINAMCFENVSIPNNTCLTEGLNCRKESTPAINITLEAVFLNGTNEKVSILIHNENWNSIDLKDLENLNISRIGIAEKLVNDTNQVCESYRNAGGR